MKIKKYLLSLFLLLGCTLFIKTNNLLASSSFISVNDEVEIDKDINMTLTLSLVDYDVFELIITSNVSLDTLSSNDVTINKDGDESYFEYNINASELKKISLKYKLPSTVNAGDKITFYFRLVNKENEEEMTDLRKTVTVIDTKEEEKEEEPKQDEKEKPSNSVKKYQRPAMGSAMNTGFKISNSFSTKKVTYPGSDNNYLSSLSVKGYSFQRKFSNDGLTYFVTVKNNVKSIKVTAKKDSSKSKVNISGNNNLQVGMNKVLVTVTSESGRVRQYRIFVTREEE